MKIDKKTKFHLSIHNWAIIFFAVTYTTPNTFWMFVDIGSRWLKMCGFDVRIWMLCLKKRWAFSTRHFATLRNRSSKISSVFWGRSCWVVIHALNSWSFASISSAGIVSMLPTNSLSFAAAARLKLNLKCRKAVRKCTHETCSCRNFSYLVFCMVNTLIAASETCLGCIRSDEKLV